jgi:hypothetical protein
MNSLLFSSNTYEMLFSYKMEPDAREEPSPVRAIHFLPGELKLFFYQ